MSTPQIDVAYIAKLARIDLTEEETALFSKDLDKVLAYITKLESYDVTGIAPMNHPLPAMDVMREDIPETGFTQEEALSNAPQQTVFTLSFSCQKFKAPWPSGMTACAARNSPLPNWST